MRKYAREEILTKVKSGAELRRADLIDADMSGAFLARANLSRAKCLRGADLSRHPGLRGAA